MYVVTSEQSIHVSFLSRKPTSNRTVVKHLILEKPRKISTRVLRSRERNASLSNSRYVNLNLAPLTAAIAACISTLLKVVHRQESIFKIPTLFLHNSAYHGRPTIFADLFTISTLRTTPLRDLSQRFTERRLSPSQIGHSSAIV